MWLKRCSQMLVAAFLSSTALALLLDEPGILLISFTLFLLLMIRCLLFFSRSQKIASSIVVSRTPGKLMTRQGFPIGMTVTITLQGEEGFHVRYTDTLASGMNQEQGTLHGVCSGPGMHTLHLSYQFIPLIHGVMTLPGGLLTMTDPFFGLDLPLSGKSYAGPEIRVQPSPFFETGRERTRYGGIEVQRVSSIKGSSIRQYREYIPGDDYRQIDWKLSAKKDTLVVREFMGLEDYPPLIIVDLPDREAEYDHDGFTTLVSAVSGIIEKHIRNTSVSLLIISGPNIIDMIYEEYDWIRYMRIIREKLHPHIRLHHMYRVKQRSTIRDQIRKIQQHQGSETSLEDYLTHLVKIYHNSLVWTGLSQFSASLLRAVSPVKTDEIYLYSLCESDLSHIQEIALQARHQKVKFMIKTPDIHSPERIREIQQILRGETVEVLA